MQTQLVILTRNRPNLLVKTLNSAILQTVPFTKIIVSDNSSKEHLWLRQMEGIAKDYERYETISFIPTEKELTAHEHFAFIQRTYIPNDDSLSIIFHDDDEFTPDYHKNLLEIFKRNPKYVAASCNAFILKHSVETKYTIMRTTRGYIRLSSKFDFFRYYLGFEPIAPPPFSAYCYKSNILRRLNFSLKFGGKYSDVAGLSQLLESGPVIWITEPLIRYRIHPNQDSQVNNIVARRLLIRYVKNQCKEEVSLKMISSYRVKYLLSKITLKPKFIKRSWAITHYVGKVLASHMIGSKNFYIFLFSVAFKKKWKG